LYFLSARGRGAPDGLPVGEGSRREVSFQLGEKEERGDGVAKRKTFSVPREAVLFDSAGIFFFSSTEFSVEEFSVEN
jgi:hypothetical protein